MRAWPVAIFLQLAGLAGKIAVCGRSAGPEIQVGLSQSPQTSSNCAPTADSQTPHGAPPARAPRSNSGLAGKIGVCGRSAAPVIQVGLSQSPQTSSNCAPRPTRKRRAARPPARAPRSNSPGWPERSLSAAGARGRRSKWA